METNQKTVEIRCPACGDTQSIILVEHINFSTQPELRNALIENRLNRVVCEQCEKTFRIDLPIVCYLPEQNSMIHWIPETRTLSRDQILDDFEASLEELLEVLPAAAKTPEIYLVLARVELVELLFLLEEGFEPRVVEYLKHMLFTRNISAIPPRQFRLLLNVHDSTESELLFVVQNVQTQQLERVFQYDRAVYDSTLELYQETPDEFLDMFPAPYISARNLLLEELEEE